MNILIYGTMIGPGGIAHHTREFTKRLATKHNVKFINFNVPTDWDGINKPDMYSKLEELDDIHHQILHQQTLWSIDDSGKKLREFPLSGYDETFIPDVYLVMAEANHHYYYYPFESIDKPKIAYFPWETTKLRDDFFSRLQIFDQVWVPSKWQLDMVITQGYNPSKLHIVTEGVDPSVFFPIKKFEFNKFKFLHVGTWGYRKSTYEIIKSFIDIYGNNPDVELRLAINDKFLSASDEISNFNKFGLTKTDNIVFLETMSDKEYIEEIQNTDVYISCARGEGWNLPLLQAMSCGVPSIWSKVGGQLQFADGAELGCDYLYELPATYKHTVNGIEWDWPTASGFPGNLYEPDFSQFSFYMKDVYNNYDFYKNKALEFASIIHSNFDWDVSVNLAENLINNISNPKVYLNVNKTSNLSHLTSNMKILYIASHLSTGGMPEVLRARVESLLEIGECEVWVLEYSQYSDNYTTHRDAIQTMLGDKFISLGRFSDNDEVVRQKYLSVKELVDMEKFDIIHFDDIPETYDSYNKIHIDLLKFVYKSENKHWKVVETSHTSAFNGNLNKRWIPDAFMHCSEYTKNVTFSSFNGVIPTTVVEYPIWERTSNSIRPTEFDESKFNILNVGIWTPGKNQPEAIEMARYLNEQYGDKYIFHFVGAMAPNFRDYWEPLLDNLPSNVRIWDVQHHMDRFYKWADLVLFNSTYELNPIVLKEAVSYKKPLLIRDLSVYNGRYSGYAEYLTGDVINDTFTLCNMLDNPNPNPNYNFSNLQTMGNDMVDFYTKVLNENKQLNLNSPKIDAPISFSAQFVDGAFVEIIGEDIGDKYKVEFIDLDTNKVKYYVDLNTYNWANPNFKYYINWLIKITPYNTKYKPIEYKMNLTNMRILIEFKSSSLGDTIAWIPYVEEFRKKHNCTVFCSTHHNDLFVNEYKNINFIKPGETVFNLYAKYDIGWFYNSDGGVNFNKNPFDFKLYPLQKTASDILGLEYKEIRPKLDISSLSVKKEYPKLAVIATQSTAQAKYWNNPNGWDELVIYLKSIGYTVACIDKHSSFGISGHFNRIPTGVLDWTGDYPLQRRMEQILSADLFIGLGSGLSWLSWALGQKTVLISGFSEPYSEMEECIRIKPPYGKCTGCFNRNRLGDWLWCPEHKGTERQFECTKSITSDMIIEQIRYII